MVSKSEIKLVQSLKLKKLRQKYDLFVAEGDKTVKTIIKHGGYAVDRVFVKEELVKDYKSLLKNESVKCADHRALKALSHFKQPSGVVCLFKQNGYQEAAMMKEQNRVLYLSDIQDPGNLGTIIRIADWFGVQGIICSPKTADIYNSKVVQATMGSLGHIPIAKIEDESFAGMFKGHVKIGAVLTERSQSTFQVTDRPICLVVGNEGHGISPEIIDQLDIHIKIPGAVNRVAESLNASVATGILCHQIFG